MRSHCSRLLASSAAALLFLSGFAAALAQSPTITTGGVVCGADYSRSIAPGMMMSVYGQNLATATVAATAIPLPSQLDGVQVQITEPGKSAVLAPLYFVSPGQINFQMPFGLTAPSVEVRIRTAAGLSNIETVPIVARAPRLFTVTADGQGEPILVHSGDYRVVTYAAPAIPGEYVLLLLTGLGEVNPPLAAGRAGGDNAGLGPVNYVTAPVTITLGDRTLPTAFAGLMPQLAGLYQLNFQIPADFAPGLTTVRVNIGDTSSQASVAAYIGWNLPQVAAGSINPLGGTVSGSGISVIVPSGAFTAATDLRLYGVTTTADPTGRRRSPVFKLSGLPLTTNSPVTVTLDLTSALRAGESAGVVVQTEKPLRGDGYLILPATVSGNRVTVTLPSQNTDKDALKDSLDAGPASVTPLDSREQAQARIEANLNISLFPSSFDSPGGHFRIYYYADEISADKAAAAGPVLETAYQNLADLGLDWSIRTSWPVTVNLRDLSGAQGENWGEQVTSFWGINYSSLNLNSRLLAAQGITPQMRATVGHELFHLMQDFYDPRNRLYKSTRYSPWHWYLEALSTWFESLMLNDAFVPSTLAADDWAFAARHGLEYPPGDAFDVSHHGYGASMFLRFLAREGSNALPASVLRRMSARTAADPPMPQLSPVSAMKLDVPDISGAWSRFSRAFAAGTIYTTPGGFPTPNLLAGMGTTYRFDSPSDTGTTVSWNAPDLSMHGFYIDFRQQWNTGTNLSITLTDAAGTADAVVYRLGAANSWQFLGTFKGTLAVPNAEQFFQNKQTLFILVSQNRAVAPYTGSSPLSLTYRLDTAAAFPPFKVVSAPTIPGYACVVTRYTSSGSSTGNGICQDMSISNWFNWSFLSGTVPLTWNGTSFSAVGRLTQGSIYCDVNISGRAAADAKSIVTATFSKNCKSVVSDGWTELEIKYTITDIPFTGKNDADTYWFFGINSAASRQHISLITYRDQYKNPDGSMKYDMKATGPNDNATPKVEITFQGR